MILYIVGHTTIYAVRRYGETRRLDDAVKRLDETGRAEPFKLRTGARRRTVKRCD